MGPSQRFSVFFSGLVKAVTPLGSAQRRPGIASQRSHSSACVDGSGGEGLIGQRGDTYPPCLRQPWSAAALVSATARGFVLSLSLDHHPTMMEIAGDKLATSVE